MKRKYIVIMIIVYQVASWILFYIQRDTMAHGMLMLIILLLLSILIDGIIIYSFLEASKKEQLEQRINQINETQKREQEYILQTQKDAKRYRELQQGFIARLTEMQYEIKHHNSESRINQLIDETAHYLSDVKIEKFCGSEILNTVLYLKKNQAEKSDIKMRIAADVEDSIGIEDIDLCSLLCNLLDNAIEACEKIQNDDRKIDVKIRSQANFLFFDIENSYSGYLKKKNGHLLSTKKDKEEHGVGTKIIRDIVSKYDGNIKYKEKEGTFQVIVSMKEN